METKKHTPKEMTDILDRLTKSCYYNGFNERAGLMTILCGIHRLAQNIYGAPEFYVKEGVSILRAEGLSYNGEPMYYYIMTESDAETIRFRRFKKDILAKDTKVLADLILTNLCEQRGYRDLELKAMTHLLNIVKDFDVSDTIPELIGDRLVPVFKNTTTILSLGEILFGDTDVERLTKTDGTDTYYVFYKPDSIDLKLLDIEFESDIRKAKEQKEAALDAHEPFTSEELKEMYEKIDITEDTNSTVEEVLQACDDISNRYDKALKALVDAETTEEPIDTPEEVSKIEASQEQTPKPKGKKDGKRKD